MFKYLLLYNSSERNTSFIVHKNTLYIIIFFNKERVPPQKIYQAVNKATSERVNNGSIYTFYLDPSVLKTKQTNLNFNLGGKIHRASQKV